MAETVTAEVLFGINTIYSVRSEDRTLSCRIKGKVLGRQNREKRSYNPIAPGDIVEVIPDPLSPNEGLIVGVTGRKTSLTRWNKKGRAAQVLAANAELAVCISSPASPPFRPRFIDRLIVAAEAGGLEPVVVINKIDLESPPDVRERLDHYARMGYRVLRCSARSGRGIRDLAGALRGRTAVFVGQSGVGKTSIINALSPGLDLKIGEVSLKHDRGSHTTNYSSLLLIDGGLRIIDTPGVRELELADVLPEEVGFHFRDFTAHAGNCEFQPCLHTGEPGCAVAKAVEAGKIHADRYESYLRIVRELQDSARQAYG